jgi:hypothetical protein
MVRPSQRSMRRMLALALAVAFSMATVVSMPRPSPYPANPLPSPTTTKAVTDRTFPPLLTRATRRICRTRLMRPRSPRSPRPPPALVPGVAWGLRGGLLLLGSPEVAPGGRVPSFRLPALAGPVASPDAIAMAAVAAALKVEVVVEDKGRDAKQGRASRDGSLVSGEEEEEEEVVVVSAGRCLKPRRPGRPSPASWRPVAERKAGDGSSMLARGGGEGWGGDGLQCAVWLRMGREGGKPRSVRVHPQECSRAEPSHQVAIVSPHQPPPRSRPSDPAGPPRSSRAG